MRVERRNSRFLKDCLSFEAEDDSGGNETEDKPFVPQSNRSPERYLVLVAEPIFYKKGL
jgi:hypothetical protein